MSKGPIHFEISGVAASMDVSRAYLEQCYPRVLTHTAHDSRHQVGCQAGPSQHCPAARHLWGLEPTAAHPFLTLLCLLLTLERLGIALLKNLVPGRAAAGSEHQTTLLQMLQAAQEMHVPGGDELRTMVLLQEGVTDGGQGVLSDVNGPLQAQVGTQLYCLGMMLQLSGSNGPQRGGMKLQLSGLNGQVGLQKGLTNGLGTPQQFDQQLLLQRGFQPGQD